MAKKTKKRASKQVFVPPVVVTKGELIGYGRVSTEEQNLDLQVDALEKAGCLNIYTEKVSGAAKKRPQLDLAIKDLRPGDTLVVWRIDRLARSMAQFYVYLGRISEAGAGFKSLTENFDLDTATGRLVLGLLALLAEFERAITIQRTKAGIEAAKRRGATFGAKKVMTDAVKARIEKMMRMKLKGGKRRYTNDQIAKKLKIATSSIYGHFKGGRRAVERKKKS